MLYDAWERGKIPNRKKGGTATMSDKSAYVGKIKNGGTQVVKAPIQTTDAKKGTVKTGKDLRAGRK
jgi:hypothetical protein